MRLSILTVVWGAEFVDRFLSLTLRSLLAPGNLPDLSRDHDVTYDVYAPSADVARLRAHAAFALLSRTVKFRFHPFSLSDIDPENAMSHWLVWNWGVGAARKEDAYVITVAPDHVFCRGALMRWAQLFEQGYLAIHCQGVQVVLETIGEELARRFPGDSAIDLSDADMRNAMFRHLHPVMITMFRESARWIAHPECHFRAVPAQGFVQRILTSHAVAFHPGRIRMTDNFSPTEKLDRVAFERGSFLSAEPLLKYVVLYLRPWRMDETMLNQFGGWADHFMSTANLRECAVTHEFAIHGEIAKAERRRSELAAQSYVRAILTSRQIFRLWRFLQESRLEYAARWLAVAHVYARLRRHLSLRQPITLFVPENRALQRVPPSECARLLAAGGATLIAAIKAHVAHGRHTLSAGDRLSRTSGGTIRMHDACRYAAGREGAVRIRRGPMRVDDMDVYVIDRPLAEVRLRPLTYRDWTRTLWETLSRSKRRVIQAGKEAIILVLRRRRSLYLLALRLREQARIWWQRALRSGQREPGSRARARFAPVDPQAMALYRRAMAARCLNAVQELYALYANRVLSGARLTSSPAEHLSDIAEAGADQIAGWLVAATQRCPHFAEAWLELGYVREEAGDEDGAFAAFGRVLDTPGCIPPEARTSDLHARAALKRAQLMMRRGQPESALTELDTARHSPFLPRNFALVRARALLSVGRRDEAMAAFERCLEWRHFEPRFSNFCPRDLDSLRETMKR